jgi:hypothetical protein
MARRFSLLLLVLALLIGAAVASPLETRDGKRPAPKDQKRPPSPPPAPPAPKKNDYKDKKPAKPIATVTRTAVSTTSAVKTVTLIPTEIPFDFKCAVPKFVAEKNGDGKFVIKDKDGKDGDVCSLEPGVASSDQSAS